MRQIGLLDQTVVRIGFLLFLLCVRFLVLIVSRSFLSEMSSTVDSEAIDSIGGLAAIAHVLTIVRTSECADLSHTHTHIVIC